MYVYLAIDGSVPTFASSKVCVIPGSAGGDDNSVPCRIDMSYGTCIKLYDYRWSKKTVLTLDARRELQRFLVEPALPYRLYETREGYTAHSLASTVSGAMLAAEDEGELDIRLEPGFPSYGTALVKGVGELPYRIYAFNRNIESRDVPTGVVFLINGQSHGQMPARFLSSTVRLSYLTRDQGPLLIVVDCTQMEPRAREDFFLASRDRVRTGGEIYLEIRESLREILSTHTGLKLLNQRRREEELLSTADGEREVDRFQQLIEADPGLKQLFGFGDRLVTRTGPGEQRPFDGKEFPTFFRVARTRETAYTKGIPIGRFGYVEFETDATNDYFNRTDSPGTLRVSAPELVVRQNLWNGRFNLGLELPDGAKVGDEVAIKITVTDVERNASGGPFESTVILRAEPPRRDNRHEQGKPNQPRDPSGRDTASAPVLSLPKITLVGRDQWLNHGFSEVRAIDIQHAPDGGFDFYLNSENAFLLTELKRTDDAYKLSVRDAFNYGLTFAALALIRHQKIENSGDYDIDIEQVVSACDGLARVLVPTIRTLGLHRKEED